MPAGGAACARLSPSAWRRSPCGWRGRPVARQGNRTAGQPVLRRDTREIAMFAEAARDAIDDLANSRGRSTRHLLVGLGLTAGAVLASALIARANTPTLDHPKVERRYDRPDKPSFSPPKAAFAMIWPPLFLALTLSGLRVWNARASPARTQALTL